MTIARDRSFIIPPSERIGLSRAEAAEYVGVSPSFFDQLVGDRRMPRPKRVGARTIWDRRQLDRAFAELPEEGGSTHDRAGVDPYSETAA